MTEPHRIAGDVADAATSSLWRDRRALSYLVTACGLLATGLALRSVQWQGAAQLHTLMEALATLLALFVGVLALIRYFSQLDRQFLYIGAGFVGTALLDGYHCLVTSTFFEHFMPSDNTTLVPWSWFAARLYLSLLMVLSWLLLLGRPAGQPAAPDHRRVFAITALTTLATFLFFAFTPLPSFRHPDNLFARPFDLLPGLLFLVALAGYLYKGRWRTDAFEHWLVLSLIVGAMLQISFISFSDRLYDIEFDIAHLLKKVSYLFVLTGLLVNLYQAWAQVKDEILQREQAQADLARSNADLEQFAYAISHDMRQPLRMVTSYLQLVERALRDRLDDDTRQYMAFAKDGARRMESMIQGLLEFSRVGRKADPRALLELRDALDEALAFLGPEIAATGGTVTVSGAWIVNCASRDEMVRLFQNLVGNALKYHPAGVAPQVEVCGEQRAKVWRCEVRDHGIGIDPAEVARLFKVFSRLQSHSRYEGAGVGLALCRKIVEHHGGRIGVVSAGDGQGSTFWFELPLCDDVAAVRGDMAGVTAS